MGVLSIYRCVGYVCLRGWIRSIERSGPSDTNSPFYWFIQQEICHFFKYCQGADEEKIATSTDFSLKRKSKAEYPLRVTAKINWGKNKSLKSCKSISVTKKSLMETGCFVTEFLKVKQIMQSKSKCDNVLHLSGVPSPSLPISLLNSTHVPVFTLEHW